MKKIKKILSSPRNVLVIIITSLFTASILFTLMVFGIDNILINTTLEGYVQDINNDPIANATISIQNRETSTDKDGYYKLERLNFGLYSINVSKNGYNSTKEELSIERFGNSKDFVLEPQEHGDASFLLIPPSEENLNLDSLVISINSHPLEIDGNTALTEKLLTGEYDFSLSSPFYVDIQNSFTIEPGSQFIELSLISAANVYVEATDFLSGAAVEPDEVFVQNKGVFEQVSAENIVGNKIAILNLPYPESTIIKIFKKGYIDFEEEILLSTGENSLGEINLIPEGTIVSQVSNDIVISNYDGSDLKVILPQDQSCVLLSQSAQIAAAKCNNTYRIIDIANATIIDTYYSDAEAIIDIDNSDLLKLNFPTVGSLSNKSGVIINKEDRITSAVTNGNQIMYTTNGSVWKINKSSNEAIKLIDGSFSLAAISFDGNSSLLYKSVGGSSTIWKLNNTSGEITKLTFQPSKYSNIAYIDNNTFIFTEDKSLYSQNISTTEAKELDTDVDKALIIRGTSLILLTKSQNRYLLDTASGHLAKFEI